MPRFEVKQSAKLNLTSNSGLGAGRAVLPGGAVGGGDRSEIAGSQGMRTSDLVTAMMGQLSMGESDFEAI